MSHQIVSLCANKYRVNKFNESELECPECGEWAQANHVDNGVGMQRCGPYVCDRCGWIEEDKIVIPFDDE
jgi:ribosomal protein S27AE